MGRSLAIKAALLVAATAAVLWIGWEQPAGTPPEAPRDGSASHLASSVPGAAPGAPLDLNRATTAELAALPGIGEVLAGRIVQYRERHGFYDKVERLLEVKGIGAGRLARLRPHLRTTGGPSTVGTSAQPAVALEKSRGRS